MSEYIEIGVIGRPHGIKGEVHVAYYAESLDLLQDALFLQAGEEAPRPVAVQSMRIVQGEPLVIFEGVNDRSSAEILRGQALLINRSHLPELSEEEAYLDDVIGFTIIDNETDKLLGTLDYAMFHVEPEIWAVKTPNGKEFYMPAAPQFIIGFDFDKKTIRVALPEGLLEVYGIVS